MAKRHCNPSIAWNVYLRGKLIDTVFFTTDYTAEEVRRSLIDHDGYDSGITVRRRAKPKTSNPATTSGTLAYRAGHRAYYSGYARDAALRLYLKSLMGMDLHAKLSAKREFIQGWDAVASGVLREVRTGRRTANPSPRRGTVRDIPSTWTPAKIKRVGRGIQIRMRGR
jgi:hypothetical protein